MNDSRKKDLRPTGRSDDGAYLELVDNEGKTYEVRISDHLRATINQPRLVAVVDPQLRPTFSVKDIQARLRAGESIDSISRTTDWSREKIERFAGPVLQERAYVISLALASIVTREERASLNLTLQDASTKQLTTHGVDMDQAEWNTHRKVDGHWILILRFPSAHGESLATWNFDLEKRALTCLDENASWICGERVQRSNRVEAEPKENVPAPRLVGLVGLAAVKQEMEPAEEFALNDRNLQDLKESDSSPSVGSSEFDNDFDDIFTSDSEDQSAQISSVVEEPENPVRDGVTARVKLPSWDDIMFGSKEQGD
jgi:Protein of unknown function (DUF3071)